MKRREEARKKTEKKETERRRWRKVKESGWEERMVEDRPPIVCAALGRFKKEPERKKKSLYLGSQVCVSLYRVFLPSFRGETLYRQRCFFSVSLRFYFLDVLFFAAVTAGNAAGGAPKKNGKTRADFDSLLFLNQSFRVDKKKSGEKREKSRSQRRRGGLPLT